MNGTALRGLTEGEVSRRVRAGQVNRVRRSHAAEYRDIVVRNVFTLFNGLVVPAAVALLALGEYRGGVAVCGMATINSLMGLIQELRAKRHLDKLELLAESRAQAIRDGQPCVIPAGEVVQGDLVRLTSGEPVVADGEVLEARFLEVDEALLTGESDPVLRKPGEQVLSGSYCVAGEGVYRADRVGSEAFAHSTAAEARAYRYLASPLQQAINRLLRWLTGIAVTLCASYLVLYLLRDDITEVELFQMIAATITSMVPQGLVLMTTLAFILGAVRMSRRGAVVQRIAAVETMAAVTLLCMDKTGTLTTNRLELDRVVPLNDHLTDEEIRTRLRLFASTSIDQQNKNLRAIRQALGDATAELLDQIPFKSQNRYSAVRLRVEGRELVLALGAVEALERLFDSRQGPDWRQTWESLLPTGLRLLVFADGERQTPFDGTLEGCSLRPLALVAFRDELRPEAGEVLRDLANQGVAFKVISGDNPDTVRATTAPLDLPLAREKVVSGDMLAGAADADALIRNTGVFGRVAPRQKVQIVQSLQASGEIVAMIGDGVNDVLPIKGADLGIAMGEGSQATKTVAGLVLENNDFQLLPQTLDEGRTIVRNLRRSAKLFLLKNVYALILIVGGVLLMHQPFPFLPQQVTLLNLLTIGIPALVITLSREPSLAARRRGFLRDTGGFALGTGLVMGTGGLTLMLWAAHQYPTASDAEDDVGLMTRRTILLAGLVLMGVTALWRVLSDGEEKSLPGDRKLRWLALAVLPVFLVTLYWAPVANFFRLCPPWWGDWGVILGVAVVAYCLCHVIDRFR